MFRAVEKRDFLNATCLPLYRWFQSERFGNLETLNWRKIKAYAKRFGKVKLNYLVLLLEFYKDSEWYEDYR
jgi:hypothetical protein